MEMAGDIGSISDAKDAVRRVLLAVTPKWLLAGQTLLLAATCAMFFGAGKFGDNIYVAAALGYVLLGFTVLIQRRRGARTFSREPFTAPHYLANLGGVLLVLILLGSVRYLTEGGTFRAYALQFVLALVLFGGMQVALWTLSIRRVQRVGGAVALSDEVIRPRECLMFCAALTQVTEIRSDLLAHALALNAPTFNELFDRLSKAGYVTSRRDQRGSRRPWVALTSRGRAAYDAHMCALG